MWQTCTEVAGVLGATALLAPLLILPGGAIAALTGWLFAKDLERSYRWGIALLFSLAVLPSLLSVIARLVSFDAAVAAQIVLALAGIPAVRKMGWPPPAAVLGLLAWSLVVAFEFVDFHLGGKLYQSTLVLDLVAHVATVNSILTWGLPLTDPFVSRAAPAGYYYFFYVLAAVPVRLTMGLLDARAAVAAFASWEGAALLALAGLLWQKTTARATISRNAVLTLVALLLCGNLDIVPNLAAIVSLHVWPIQLEWWNEQITPWTVSLLWVPHHVLALLAGIFGLLLISERSGTASAVAAGFAFASCAGASVWVGLCIALAALLWLATLVRRQPRTALTLAAAGCLASVLLIPECLDILHGRADQGSPIALTIRAFFFLDGAVAPGLTRDLLRLVFLPVNYFIEFGIFAVGAILYWRNRHLAMKSEAARVLAITAAAGLLVGTFMRSTLLHNDLGWRAMLLPQLAFLVWTAAVILNHAGSGKFSLRGCLQWPAAMGALLLIGYAGTLYETVSVRAYPLLAPNVVLVPHIAFNPRIDAELSSAYEWASTHIPREILQHNPVGDARVVDFGLYGRNRVAVADHEATLYGASRADVRARLADIAPIFTKPLSAAAVEARASAYGIGVLVVSSADPIWSDRGDWVWSTPALYIQPDVRLIATRDLARER